jgi:hypothetical protein
MTRRNLFAGIAPAVLIGAVLVGTVLVGAAAAALTWTAAAASAPFAFASSATARQLPGDGVERFTNVVAKLPADRLSMAPSAAAPAGMQRFVGVATTPLAAEPGGSAFATLYVSAAVVVTAFEPGAAHVTARLWMHGNAADSGPLYTVPKGVEVGQLDAVSAVHAIPGTAVNGWTPVEIDGYLAAGVIVDNLESVWQTTRFDYQFVCADCHSLHVAEEYSSMQWDPIMVRMARFAKLLPDDAMIILKWLQTTSFERRPPMTATLARPVSG